MKKFLFLILLFSVSAGAQDFDVLRTRFTAADRAQLDSILAADPDAASRLAMTLARMVGRKSPAGFEDYVAQVATKAAEVDASTAVDAALYIANNYCIVWADAAAAKPWVDRYLLWGKGVDPDPRVTRAVREAFGEVPLKDAGKQMPDYELRKLDGGAMRLSELRGKYVLLDFWASWCGPCRAEVPHVKEAYEAVRDLPVIFVSISSDKDDAAWRRAAAEIDVPWLHLSSHGTDMLKAYGVAGIPRIMVLDPQGRLVADHLTGKTIVPQLSKLGIRN